MRSPTYRFYAAATVFILLPLLLSTSAAAESHEQVIYSFSGDCFNPMAPLVADERGNLYGTAFNGGVKSGGCVFELSRTSDGSWSERSLHTFRGADGYWPVAALILDKFGNLYGTASSGGTYGGGVAFRLSPSPAGSWTEAVLYNFGNSDGTYPTELVFDNDGNLYGTNQFGGSGGGGTVFKLSPNQGGGWTETILYAFPGNWPNGCSGPDGCNPSGGVALDSEGRLYGTTQGGGANGMGAVYELAPSNGGSYQERLIHSFSGPDGAPPFSRLVRDSTGNLYGTTFDGGNLDACYPTGCGAVFKLTRDDTGNWTESVLYALSSRKDGYSAAGPVVFDLAGNLYAAAALGPAGLGFDGSIYRLTPRGDGSWAETPLHKFPWPSTGDGAAPYAGLILSKGELFGTTLIGGAQKNGTVFSIKVSESIPAVLTSSQ